MPSDVDWCSAWETARSLSPYSTFGVTPERAVAHWDRISEHYDCDAVGSIDELTWDVLVREGLVPKGGTVLDIGCGTGALTERFARAGTKVLGLDISPGMLSLARQRCSGLENAVFVCQDWNAFSAVHGFDLVFSSFCPGVDGLPSILRMESISMGMCCLVSLGRSTGRPLAFEILAELGAPGLSLEAFDPLYPYNVLRDMGRDPVMKEFRVCHEVHMDEEEAMDDLVCFISLFQDVTAREMRIIRRAVAERLREGRLAWREERTVRVLFWSVDGGVRNGPWL